MDHLTQEQLNEFHDQAMNESARVKVEAHLRVCDGCRAKLNELQSLISELDELPEAHLEHDLTPGILARLPRKEVVRTWMWTRAFAAQMGVVVGFFFWLGTLIVPLIHVPQVSVPNIPPVNLQTLTARLLSIQFPIPEFQLPVVNYQMPIFDFQLPAFPLQLSSTHAVALAVSTLLLWVVGNVILLKSRQEVRS